MNMTENHPWITECLDNDEFEAVLAITHNGIPPWDADGVLRGFQTFQWSGVPGADRVSFVHDETGVIICYEGNIVGIECGHGSLKEALPDLIQVLISLGWRSADVYSLPSRQQEVMDALAKSIPASADFDITFGKRTPAPVSGVLEASGLVEHTRALLQTVGQSDTVLMQTFDSLTSPSAVPSVQSETLQHPILFDIEEDDGPLIIAPSLLAQAQVAPGPVHAASSEENEEAVVFSLAANSDVNRKFSPLPQAQEIEPAPTAAPVLKMVAPLLPSSSDLGAGADRNSDRQRINSNNSKPVYKKHNAGRSIFFFPGDDASSPAEFDDDDFLAALCEKENMVGAPIRHLYPGRPDPEWRWNMLAELDQNYPAFADKLLSIARREGKFSSASFLAITSAALLANCENDDPTDGIANPLTADLDQLFRDKKHFCSPFEQGSGCKMFSVRKTILEQERAIYLVHFDDMDGPLIRWVIDMLKGVVCTLDGSSWLMKQIPRQEETAAEVPPETAEPPLPATVMNALSQLGDLVQTLHAAGIRLPQSMPVNA